MHPCIYYDKEKKPPRRFPLGEKREGKNTDMYWIKAANLRQKDERNQIIVFCIIFIVNSSFWQDLQQKNKQQ